VTGAIEQLLIKHKKAQVILDVGPTYYWGTLVKDGKIEVVGSKKAGRAVYSSVRRYVEEERRAKIAAAEKKA
jgi:hypothetical protein